MCSHKCNEIESIFHVLLEYKYSKRIWKYPQNLINKPLTLKKENFIFNTFNSNSNDIVNTIELCTKQFLSRHRCQKKIQTYIS